MAMLSPVNVYAVALAGVLLVLILSKALTTCLYILQRWRLYWVTNLLSRDVFRIREWSSCTWLTMVWQLFLVCGNLLLVIFPMTDIESAARKAGEIAVLDIALFYIGPHLSFVADLLGLSLLVTKSIHRSMTLPFVIIVTFHLVVLQPSQPVFRTPFSREFYGVIASLAAATLLLTCLWLIRRRWYEFWLRTHQILAGIMLCMIWLHTHDSTRATTQYALISIIGMFGASSLGQLLLILKVNRFFLGNLPRAEVAIKANIMRLTVDVPSALKVQPGQHINVCMPGVSVSSFLQSHPLVIVSAQQHDDKTVLQLVLEARRGWTSKLYARISDHKYTNEKQAKERSTYLCLFSGPHGHRRNVDDYGVVVLIASGWGVLGLLPYLQQLIQGHNNFTTKARRIHLIWQLQDADDGRPIEDLVDRALDEDTVDGGYILKLSVYYLTGNPVTQPGRRVMFHKGVAKWQQLIEYELHRPWSVLTSSEQFAATDPESASNVSAFCREQPRILILVCAARAIRSCVQLCCQRSLSAQVKFVELDYQPND